MELRKLKRYLLPLVEEKAILKLERFAMNLEASIRE